MADAKISQLVEHVTAILGVDLLALVANTSTTPVNHKVQVKTFFSNIQVDLPATSASALKMTGYVTSNTTTATLIGGDFGLVSNSSIGVTTRDRIGLRAVNEIQNGNSAITGQFWGGHVRLDSGNSATVASNTYGFVIEHTLNVAVASARITAPRAYLAFKEKAGSGNTTTYLMDIGAQSNTVSASETANANVVYSRTSDTAVNRMIRVCINGEDIWLHGSNTAPS